MWEEEEDLLVSFIVFLHYLLVLKSTGNKWTLSPRGRFISLLIAILWFRSLDPCKVCKGRESSKASFGQQMEEKEWKEWNFSKVVGGWTNSPKHVKVVYCSGKWDFGIQGKKNSKEWNVNATLLSGGFSSSSSHDWTVGGHLRMEIKWKYVKEISLLILSREMEFLFLFRTESGIKPLCPRNSFTIETNSVPLIFKSNLLN